MRTYTAHVEAVLLTPDPGSFVTAQVPALAMDLAGIPGDRHYGLLRPADVRQSFYPRGTMIANRRQISIISAEEMADVAKAIGIAEIKPEWLGANILLSGYPELTKLPKGARMLFAGGVGLISEGENEPCTGPGRVIARESGDDSLTKRFVAAARQRRGIVCSVEKEGTIRSGETVSIMIL